MGWSINPAYKELKEAYNPYHDLKTTTATIKELLKDGTPDWFSHPEDYKAFAKEAFQAEREISNSMVQEYRMDDEDILTDFKSRNINITGTKEFVLKLRENGVRCFALYNGMPGTVGLWCVVPTKNGTDVRYIAYMQKPAMIEWSVLALDDHGLPAGESYRGWRTVLCEMIKKGVLTEQRAHEIFGAPTDSIVSRRYRRTLFEFRHRKENVAPRDGF